MSGLFPNTWHVARREYLTRVRSRSFAIASSLLGVVVAGVILLPVVLSAIGVDDPPAIAIHVAAPDLSLDPVGELRASLTVSSEVEEDRAPSVTSVDDPDAAADQVRSGELDGLLTIGRRGEELTFDYLTSDSPTGTTRLLVEQAAHQMAISDRLERAGIDIPAAQIIAPAAFDAASADPDEGGLSPEDFGPALLVAYAIVILTFMAILTYGNWVAQSVTEEKTSRVMELLITAATPRQLLAGKVLGTGAAGLTQYLVLVVAAVIAFIASAPLGAAIGVPAGELPQLPTFTLAISLSLAGFFFGGFLLYCTLYAAVGSMVSRQEDVQQASGLLVTLAMVGYLASFAALNVPDAEWVAILSLVPFFSPYFMPIRMLLATPSAIEVVAALAILGVTLLGAVWVAARIYSAGVLLYGQRPGIRQVLRAARVAR